MPTGEHSEPIPYCPPSHFADGARTSRVYAKGWLFMGLSALAESAAWLTDSVTCSLRAASTRLRIESDIVDGQIELTAELEAETEN